MSETNTEFKIDEELDRFNALEGEVNETLKMINSIIEMFTGKAELAKGSTGKLVLLIEQKISLLTRKESIIKSVADMKKNLFNTNVKLKGGDADNDLARVMMEYTDAIKKQQKTMMDAKMNVESLIKNASEVDDYFSSKAKQ